MNHSAFSRLKSNGRRKKPQEDRGSLPQEQDRSSGRGSPAGSVAAEAASGQPETAWRQVPTGSDQASTLLPSIQGRDVLQDLTCGVRVVKA